MRKYLEDIGVKDYPEAWSKNSKRQKRWKRQQRLYGFDERETWDLHWSFYYWLYERLMCYLEVCNIDLSYHKFTYCNRKYTQEQLIDMMLERLRFSFSEDYDEFNNEHWNYVHETEKIWAIILPSMWW